ncbi:unnamed protein product, partial [Polarella glacialis]
MEDDSAEPEACNTASRGLMEMLAVERKRLQAELKLLRAAPFPQPAAAAVLRRQWCGGVTGGSWPSNRLAEMPRHVQSQSELPQARRPPTQRWTDRRLAEEEEQLLQSSEAAIENTEIRRRILIRAQIRAEAAFPAESAETRLAKLDAREKQLREQLAAAEAQYHGETKALESLRRGRTAAEELWVAEQIRWTEEISQAGSALKDKVDAAAAGNFGWEMRLEMLRTRDETLVRSSSLAAVSMHGSRSPEVGPRFATRLLGGAKSPEYQEPKIDSPVLHLRDSLVSPDSAKPSPVSQGTPVLHLWGLSPERS